MDELDKNVEECSAIYQRGRERTFFLAFSDFFFSMKIREITSDRRNLPEMKTLNISNRLFLFSFLIE